MLLRFSKFLLMLPFSGTAVAPLSAPSPPPKQVLTLVPPCLIVVCGASRFVQAPQPPCSLKSPHPSCTHLTANHFSAQADAKQQLLSQILSLECAMEIGNHPPDQFVFIFYIALWLYPCPHIPTTLERRSLVILLVLKLSAMAEGLRIVALPPPLSMGHREALARISVSISGSVQ